MKKAFTSKDIFPTNKAISKNNSSLTKSLPLNSSSMTPYPIKPKENIIPKDLNLQKIFANMMKSSQDFSKIYSPLIIKNIYSKFTLNSNNDISRKNNLIKIRDFFLFYNINYKIYFKTILLYDIISLENETKHLLSSKEEIALGSLILSIKFYYNENKMFSFKKFLMLYGEKVYSLKEMISIERRALKTINYFLNFTTPMCFLELFLLNGIIYNIDNVDKNDYSKIYFEIEDILEKIMEESIIYLKYNFFYLACAIVSYCREKYHLEKWPKMLKKVFGVDFYFFQNEYKFLVDKNNTTYINQNNCNNKSFSQKTFNSNIKRNLILKGNNSVFLDLKNLNNNKSTKSKRNIVYDKYKNDYCAKTIHHYTSIKNKNINNGIFNSKLNNNIIDNNLTEKNILNILNKSNRFIINNNKNISYCIDENTINENISYNDSLINNKTYMKNNKNQENMNNNNLMTDLTEIKEVKDLFEEKNYISPRKSKTKFNYIFKRKKENNKIEETKEEEIEKGKDNKNEEIPKNKNEHNKRIQYSNIRKIYTYTYDKNNNHNFNYENEIKNKENKKNNYQNREINNTNYKNQQEEINKYNFMSKSNKTLWNPIKESNIKIHKEENKNEKISPDKKQNNRLISNYFNFTYYKTDKKNSDRKLFIKNAFNIKPKNIEKEENKNNLEKISTNLSYEKKDNLKFKNSYRFYKNNISNMNNYDKINDIKINLSKKINKNINIAYKEKNISNIKTKQEKKFKYIDLLKYKLSKCDSISKIKHY